MNEAKDPSRDLPEQPGRELPYRSGIDDRREQPWIPIAGQVGVGSFLTCAGLFVIQILIVAMTASAGGTVLIVGLSIICLCLAATRVHQIEKDRGWALGIWIGVGLVALANGICFVLA
jgi:hypothetical protein